MTLLSRLNRTQRISAILLFILLANGVIGAATGYSVGRIAAALLVAAFLILLPFAVLPPIVRKITWRVRYRLFVTYFLVGILPIFLILLFVQMGFYMVLAQVTNYLLRQELNRRIEQVYLRAESLAQTAAAGNDVTGVDEGESAILRQGERRRTIPESGQITVFPEWSRSGFKGILRNSAGKYFLAAHAASGEGNRQADVFAARELDAALLAELLPGVASVQLVEGTTVRFRINAGQGPSDVKVVITSEGIQPPPPARGFWDSAIETGSPLELQSLETAGKAESALIAETRPSAILKLVFSTLGNVAVVLQVFMIVVGAVFLLVEIIAVIACIKLARTLTGTVHDLYAGTKQVEGGDFSHRIPVRAKDQLSELASSFNGMTQRIEQLIGEVKEKEKLESELEIARQVQAQLFPKTVPKLKTLELAGVCNPARVVSGDYYDFIPIESRGAAVVVGDISGKGISAALLMASVQASLHAQLAMGGEEVSTATLVTRLNRQLYENTPPEKYATFYCAVYDDLNSRLTYTNAGHLAPILIRDGEVMRLESNGTVVGIFPEYSFEQIDVDLHHGDLLAAFTDGITESENDREEQFGEDRLIDLLRKNSAKPLDEIIQTVMDTVGAWAHDPAMRDDITMLLARKF